MLGDSSFYDPALADSLSELERNPLWSTLPAVKAGRVVQIPGPIYNGGNYYAGGSKMTPQLLGRPTIVDDLPRREFIVDDPSGLISQVSNDLGLTPFKLVAKTPADHTKLSLEELGQLEGVDYIMFAEYPSENHWSGRPKEAVWSIPTHFGRTCPRSGGTGWWGTRASSTMCLR